MIGNAITGVAICSLLLAACGTPGGTIYKKDVFGPYNVLSLDARQRLVVQGARLDEDGTPHPVVCSEPSPDAIAAQAAALAASANVPASGTAQTIGAQLSGGFSESAASIAMRTQTIQLLRDGYYRLCEAYMNGVIDRLDYRDIILFIDEFIATVAAIEAIGGTVQTAPVAINTSMSSSTNKEAADVDSNPGGGGSFPASLTVNTNGLDPTRAEQIKQILEHYYARKREYQMLGAKARARR